MASLEELGACNPSDSMDEECITALCGFKGSTGGARGTSTGGLSEDRLRSAAMEQALSDVASIANTAASQRPKLTRETFKETIRRFMVAGGQAEALCSGPGPLCFAVIHAKDAEQVTNNVQVALEEGVAGVFIVNHDFDYPQMLPILRQVRGRFPDAFLGVNFHMMNGAEAFPILGRLACEGVKIDAFWADNACIDAHSIDQGGAVVMQDAEVMSASVACVFAPTRHPSAEMISLTRQRSGWDGLYFGGTAFKNLKQHQKLCAPVPTEELTHVSEAASRYMDVVTTSAPDVPAERAELEKISLMRAGCPDTPLCVDLDSLLPAAVAPHSLPAGAAPHSHSSPPAAIEPHLLESFAEHVDCFFAASCIQTGDVRGDLLWCGLGGALVAVLHRRGLAAQFENLTYANVTGDKTKVDAAKLRALLAVIATAPATLSQRLSALTTT